ncbi:MAG: hypothetical protein A3C07_01985 [Candidatus Sungbacteria bacterium RIFCSPHIGHO2_02_FULL_47_11]|uniref:Response regulatory domain-containing protein n=1 Tax=Candidatus Sungbacteria bacterium RIFCSPHIGHO2_02_FULL_47_11 TaxID=1802270 RepID=A0A1G2KNE4_9BACT|nr:MAG: hypothetical protein A3C07_01985 [Candidatus Sungbacteria bacterium RIFCSPHIGHO2_02_FULL_47_11]
MSANKKKIALLDDDEILARLTVGELTKAGFTVMHASDGEAGWKLIQAELPELVLLDIVMPKLDGIGVLKKIKEDEKTKNIPVVMLTNLDDTQKVAEAMQLGARSYLVKTDWKISDVIKKVEELFPKS